MQSQQMLPEGSDVNQTSSMQGITPIQNPNKEEIAEQNPNKPEIIEFKVYTTDMLKIETVNKGEVVKNAKYTKVAQRYYLPKGLSELLCREFQYPKALADKLTIIFMSTRKDAENARDSVRHLPENSKFVSRLYIDESTFSTVFSVEEGKSNNYFDKPVRHFADSNVSTWLNNLNKLLLTEPKTAADITRKRNLKIAFNDFLVEFQNQSVTNSNLNEVSSESNTVSANTTSTAHTTTAISQDKETKETSSKIKKAVTSNTTKKKTVNKSSSSKTKTITNEKASQETVNKTKNQILSKINEINELLKTLPPSIAKELLQNNPLILPQEIPTIDLDMQDFPAELDKDKSATNVNDHQETSEYNAYKRKHGDDNALSEHSKSNQLTQHPTQPSMQTGIQTDEQQAQKKQKIANEVVSSDNQISSFDDYVDNFVLSNAISETDEELTDTYHDKDILPGNSATDETNSILTKLTNYITLLWTKTKWEIRADITDEQKKRMQARYDAANMQSLLYPRRTMSTTKGTGNAKHKSYYSGYGMKSLSAIHNFYKMKGLPGPLDTNAIDQYSFDQSNNQHGEIDLPGGELPLGQFANTCNFPYLTQPFDDKYTFRDLDGIYHDKTKRKAFLEQYYLPFMQANMHKQAAIAILILFQHIVKEFVHSGLPRAQLRTFINYKLARLGFVPMTREIMSALNSILQEDFRSLKLHANAITSKYTLDPSDKRPKLKKEDYESSLKQDEMEIKESKQEILEENTKSTVRKVWVKKMVEDVEEGMLIDDISDYKIFANEDVDVYDEDSGYLIASLRVDRIKKDDIDRFNKYGFNFTPNDMKTNGAGSQCDIDNDNENRKSKTLGDDKTKRKSRSLGKDKSKRKSMVFGILGKDTQDVALSSAITNSVFAPDILNALTGMVKEMERLYAEVAPLEFKYVSELCKPARDCMIFEDAEVTMVVEVNYDKQTRTHKDNNNLKGKTYGMMTVCTGSDEPTAEDCATLFPGYKIGFNVTQGKDGKNGDILVANFEEVHANQAIKPLNPDEPKEFEIVCGNGKKLLVTNYHRASIVAYIRGEMIKKNENLVSGKTEVTALEDSSCDELPKKKVEEQYNRDTTDKKTYRQGNSTLFAGVTRKLSKSYNPSVQNINHEGIAKQVQERRNQKKAGK